MVYPIIYRVSTIQGGAGFLPSTVCQNICHSGDHSKEGVVFFGVTTPPIGRLRCFRMRSKCSGDPGEPLSHGVQAVGIKNETTKGLISEKRSIVIYMGKTGLLSLISSPFKKKSSLLVSHFQASPPMEKKTSPWPGWFHGASPGDHILWIAHAHVKVWSPVLLKFLYMVYVYDRICIHIEYITAKKITQKNMSCIV